MPDPNIPFTFLDAEITAAQRVPINHEKNILDRSLITYETDEYFELGIGRYAFAECEMLERVSLSQMTLIKGYAFYNCRSLKVANLPEVQRIDASAFQNCSELREINMPKIITIGLDAFKGCTSLEHVSIQEQIDNIGTGAFEDCGKLTTVVYMRKNGGFSGLFEGTPISKGTGYIYVPDDSVDYYKNKGAYVNQIKGISELPK